MKFLSRLIDAAGALVIATAVLYFWGYIYYATYTEALGVPFHGIVIFPEEYLTASWLAVGTLFISFVVIVLLTPVASAVLDKFANWVRMKTNQPPLTPKERGFGSTSSEAILVLTMCAVAFGTKLMLIHGRVDAAKTLLLIQDVKVWNPDGAAIPGRFIYLRNFGSSLLVKEVSADGTITIGYRFFKEDAIGSYLLLKKGGRSDDLQKPDEAR